MPALPAAAGGVPGAATGVPEFPAAAGAVAPGAAGRLRVRRLGRVGCRPSLLVRGRGAGAARGGTGCTHDAVVVVTGVGDAIRGRAGDIEVELARGGPAGGQNVG